MSQKSIKKSKLNLSTNLIVSKLNVDAKHKSFPNTVCYVSRKTEYSYFVSENMCTSFICFQLTS